MPERKAAGAGRTCLVLHMRALGEALFALPTLHALKHADPPWRTVCVAAPNIAPLLEASGLADVVIPRGKTVQTWLRTLRAVRRERPDACLAMATSTYNTLLAFLSGARPRVGYDYAAWRWLLTTVPWAGMCVENYLRLLEPLGVPRTVDSYVGLLPVPEAAQAQADALLERSGLPPGEPFLVVSPLSTGKLGVKAYPPEHWQQVVWNLSALGHHLALVGSPGDAARHAQLMATAGPGRVVSLAGLTPTLVLAGVARRAAGVVGVDTGPLHVAAAVGTRCVVLFGPSDPALTAPCGEGHIVLYRDLECQPCQTGPCYHQGRCMRELTPRAVVEAVQRLLAGGAEPPATSLEWQPPRAAAKDASHAAG